ncbi:MAG: hypothetical protein RIR66_968, partial [Actinomycetota bacterium]
MNINPENLAAIALEIVGSSGASVGQVRVARHDTRGIALRDGQVENVASDSSTGLNVRVVHNGAWGFGATTELSEAGVRKAAAAALEMAKISSAVSTDVVDLADEPVHGKVSWKLPVEIDQMQVPDSEVIELLKSWHGKVSKHGAVHHVDVQAAMGKDVTFFADLVGNQISQDRDRTSATLT